MRQILEALQMELDEEGLRFNKLVAGGLGAFSLIVVQAFISTKIEDVAELIAVVSFAISIPLLVLFIFVFSNSELPLKTTSASGVLYTCGMFIDICGLDASFWHVSWIAGLLFILTGFVAFTVYASDAEEKHEQSLANEQPLQPPTP